METLTVKTTTCGVEINGVAYIRKDSVVDAPELNDDNYVIVRSKDSGVHAGYLEYKDSENGIVTLKNARRIWYWKGAASISQLAIDGTSCPGECKFPAPVPLIEIMGICEIIPCTLKAIKSIQSVKSWKE